MKKKQALAAFTTVFAMGMSTATNAAKLVYTTPVWTTANSTDGAARISCGALNLDKKAQTVRAEILDKDAGVLNDKSADINPGGMADIAFFSLGNVNGSLYCRFTVNNDKKVRAFATLYTINFDTIFVQDAK